ncbi:MAG: hypothetical protein PHV13_00405 [Candidatus ainarchaeum sp.]|nr:hypothetical protein [Candidatus ainarchaeum sp.]
MAYELHLALVVMLFLAALPVAFADVGPSPQPPSVVIHLVKNNMPVTTVSEITYNCLGSTDENVSNAVAPVPIKLACTAGTCTNENGWYYKFSPCFGFPGGYISYDLGHGKIRTGDFTYNESYQKYEMTIDAESGNITSRSGSSIPSCLPAFLLLLVPILLRRG